MPRLVSSKNGECVCLVQMTFMHSVCTIARPLCRTSGKSWGGGASPQVTFTGHVELLPRIQAPRISRVVRCIKFTFNIYTRRIASCYCEV